MLALKGSSAAEEIERDRTALTKLGAGKFEILECGSKFLRTPTVVVKAERLPKRRQR